MGYKENKTKRAYDNWQTLMARVRTELAIVAGTIVGLERLVSLELEAQATYFSFADTSLQGKRDAKRLKALSADAEYCRLMTERILQQRKMEILEKQLEEKSP